MKPEPQPPCTLPEGSRAAPVRRWRDGRAEPPAQDAVADEVPVALEYNGLSHAVMLASPTDLEDFALGFSLTEGLLDSPAQLHDLEAETTAQGITLHLSVAAAAFARLKDRRRTLAGRTGCGLCGTDSLDQVQRPLGPALPTGTPLAPAAIGRAMQALRAHQALQALTGATHAAAWCSADGRVHLLREDVGRHNALDKLVGALSRGPAACAGAERAAGFVIVTSRASHEMVQKTAAAGVPVLVAVSGVTTLALATAERAGLTLLGFARGDDFNVYTRGDRIAWDSPP